MAVGRTRCGLPGWADAELLVQAASVLPVGALRPSGAVGIDVMSLVLVTFPASLRHRRPAALAYLNQMI